MTKGLFAEEEKGSPATKSGSKEVEANLHCVRACSTGLLDGPSKSQVGASQAG